MDPFFKAKASFSGGGPRGGAIGYYEDLHTTYKGLPKRESALYRAAAERREIEKKGTQQIVTENEELQKNLADAYKMVEAQTVIMNELNSKLSNIDVSSKLSSDRGGKSVRIHEHEKPDRGESEAGDVRVPGNVRSPVLPDTCGPSSGDEPQGRPDSVGSEEGSSGLPGVRDGQIDEQHGSEGGVRDE